MNLVITETRNRVGILTLNNPQKRNALSRALIDDLIAALNTMKVQQARCVVLRAPQAAKYFRGPRHR